MLTTQTTDIWKASKEAYVPLNKQVKNAPAFQVFLLSPDKDGVYLVMNEFDSGEIEQRVGVSVGTWEGENFELCIPARPFRDWLAVTRKYTEKITIDLDQERLCLIIRADNTRAEFKCRPNYLFKEYTYKEGP